MLDTGSPPAAAPGASAARPAAVSPSSSLSPSSTPGISSFDGTPLHLLPSLLTSPVPSAPYPEDMVRDPHPPHAVGPQDHQQDALTASQRDAEMSEPPGRARRQISGPAGQDLPKAPLSPPSLPELARQLHRRKDQKHKSCRAQEQLHRLNVAIARTSRLVYNAKSIQQTLAECIRCEDKHAFSSLFNVFQDAVLECSTLARYNESTQCDPRDQDPSRAAPFLDTISSSSRQTILGYLAQSITHADYITDCLSALSHRELLAILPDRGAARATDSVFASGTRASARMSRPIGFTVDSQVDLLTNHSLGSPLETLVATGRSVAATVSSPDCNFTTTWATVCANLISQQKPGSERLAPALLDLWARSGPWLGKARLESWIIQVLKDGAFLLDQPHKQSFRVRVQGRRDGTTESEVQAEAFYLQAMEGLFDLIADAQGPSILPNGALEMCHAICCALQDSPNHQRAFPHFVATRWMFTSFLSNAILLPEAQGMFLQHYIPDISRNKILREIVTRCQKTFLDVAYSWKHGSFVSADNIQRVQAVLLRLQQPSNARKCVHSQTPNGPSRSLAVMSRDVMTLIDTLHPSQRSDSNSVDRDTVRSGQQSSNSSLSGFALFKATKVNDPDGAVPSTISNEYLLGGRSSSNCTKDAESEALEHRRLREAYAEIEEFYISHRHDDLEQWVVLLPDSACDGLQTFRERVKQTKSQPQLLSRKQSAVKIASNAKVTHCGPVRSSDHGIEQILLHQWDSDEGSIFQNYLSMNHGADLRVMLDRLFDEAVQSAEEEGDYVSSHAWFAHHMEFRSAFEGLDHPADLQAALSRLQEHANLSCARAECVLELCNALEGIAVAVQRRHAAQLATFQAVASELRDKMWYTADVRTSAPYDEVRSIASALRVMGKSKRSGSQTRLAPPLRSWSATRISSPSPHIKSDAQILEVLSAAPSHGGPNKLSDEQSKATAMWMERHNIENFCRGEERLHKLCMAIRKCADVLTLGQAADNPVLWASVLFSTDKTASGRLTEPHAVLSSPTLSFLDQSHRQFTVSGSRNGGSRSIDAMSSTSCTLSGSSSHELLDTRSPTLTTRSSGTLWSPATTDHATSSATSVASYHPPMVFRPAPGQEHLSRRTVPEASLEKIRQSLVSLLVSDVASGIFDDGSETDRAFWQGPGGDLTSRYLRSERALTGSPVTVQEMNGPKRNHFDFEGVFDRMLQRFANSCNPAEMMDILLDIQTLICPYMARRMKAPSFANRSNAHSKLPHSDVQHTTGQGISDINIEGFRTVFSNSSMTPTTIYRDLQYIASLTTAETLENSAQGKAFWNAGIALSGIKAEVRKIMVETADNIIAYHTNNRGHGRAASTQQQQRDSATFSAPARTPSAEEVAKYTMADAAHLLQIAAREGDTAAQRELATLYLTHPELMDHIIAPFTRPKDVFKDELESKWRKNQDPNRCDPATMCVAHHWMSLSSKGGDALAKEYLRQREEMERLP